MPTRDTAVWNPTLLSRKRKCSLLLLHYRVNAAYHYRLLILSHMENFKDSERRLTDRPRRKSFDFILEMESFGGRAEIFSTENIRQLRQAVENIRRGSPHPTPSDLY